MNKDQKLTHIPFSENALTILRHRYLDKDESPEQRFWDMCLYIASAEIDTSGNPASEGDKIYWAEKFYNELIVTKKFFPNSPTIANAGKEGKTGGLQGCVVISPEDTLESIYKTVKDWALTEKYGGGLGAYFGNIRPKGTPIATTHGQALGPVAIMKILSESAKWITQGSFREGAHMAVLPITHPDIVEFIHCKDNCRLPTDMLSNFNISVQITDKFMEAVERNEEWVLYHSDNTSGKIINARDLWNELCESTWKIGDPGLIFIDRIRETEPNPHLGLIQSTNPCGEEPLENYGSCNLGSINLYQFVQTLNDKVENIKPGNNEEVIVLNDKRSFIDWDSLKETVRLAVRFLDNVITVNDFPQAVPELREMNLKTRRIGLGVMGWHDALVKLNVPYESEIAVKLAEEISYFITQEAWAASLYLGHKKGCFPEWSNSKLKDRFHYIAFCYQLKELGIIGGPRNSSITTIAPTGTISIIAGCSSGIEPFYSLVTERKAIWKEGEAQAVIRQIPESVQAILNNQCIDITDMPGEESLTNQNIQDLLGMENNLLKTALEIHSYWHIKHQAAWQKYVTNGVSKTINLPNSSVRDNMSNAYWQAWEEQCKAITLYRDGSKDVQVLNSTDNRDTYPSGLIYAADNPDHAKMEDNKATTEISPQDRPKRVPGYTTKINTGHGKVYVTVNSLDGKPIEVFSTVGKAGGCDAAQIEAITRLASLCLRAGINANEVISQLRNITCCPLWDDGLLITSIPDAISKVLHDSLPESPDDSKLVLQENQKIKIEVKYDPDKHIVFQCVTCGGRDVIYQEGCRKCLTCGWSKCD